MTSDLSKIDRFSLGPLAVLEAWVQTGEFVLTETTTGEDGSLF